MTLQLLDLDLRRQNASDWSRLAPSAEERAKAQSLYHALLWEETMVLHALLEESKD